MAAILLVCALPSYSQSGASPEVTVLRNVNLVDVVAGAVVPHRDIVMKDGIIDIVTSGYVPREGDRIIECKGRYAIPGLIDAHMHLANDPHEPRESRLEALEYLLRHGITSVRDAAGDARVLAELKRAAALGQIDAPDIYYAAFMAGPSYYEGNDREDGMAAGMKTNRAPWVQCISAGDDLDRAMALAAGCGATGVKIYGGFDAESTARLVEAARRNGLEVWGHATLFPAKASEVAEAGVGVISHAYMLEWEEVPGALDGSMMRNYELHYDKLTHRNIPLDRFISAMKRHNSIFDPTLYLCLENGMDWSADVTRKLHESGVRICAGTDWITDTARHRPFLYDEIGLYVDKCGFTPMEALRSATIVAAAAFGGEVFTGSIEQGKDADVVILGSDPTADISNLEDIQMVFKRGKAFGIKPL